MRRIALLMVFSLAAPAFAAPKKSREMSIEKSDEKAAAKSEGEHPQVLNFDSDLIEGERKRPDLFLQVGTQRLSLDAILFRRNDFNDFHSVDKSRRPAYLLVKPRKKP